MRTLHLATDTKIVEMDAGSQQLLEKFILFKGSCWYYKNDPCPGSCGVFAVCTIMDLNAICECHEGYTGDSFAQYSLIPGVIDPQNLLIHASLP